MGRTTNKQRRATQTASAREKAAAARAVQRRQAQRRRAVAILSSAVAVAVVGALIAALVIVHVSNDNKGNRKALPATIANSVTHVNDTALTTVAKGSGAQPPTRVTGQPPLTSGGKPDLLYYGAEFCPYCAAERWSLAVALSKFGTLGNLSQVSSAKTDLDLSSLDFYRSTYSSQYLTFSPIENKTRSETKTLQTPTADQQKTLNAIGATGYPTVDFGNLLAYVKTSPIPDPTVISGLSQQQIANDLGNPSSKVAKALDGGANYDIAAICTMTKNQPSTVCSGSLIQSLESGING